MKVKELITIIFDKVKIYTVKNEEYKDIYKGSVDNIPKNILEMNIKSIGATRKSILDIRVD